MTLNSFVSELSARERRRAARRVPNRGPMDHATGTGFRRDQSTTKAVLRRVMDLPWTLRGRPVPLLDDPARAEFA